MSDHLSESQPGISAALPGLAPISQTSSLPSRVREFPEKGSNPVDPVVEPTETRGESLVGPSRSESDSVRPAGTTGFSPSLPEASVNGGARTEEPKTSIPRQVVDETTTCAPLVPESSPASADSEPSASARDDRGRWLPGNAGALQHGLFSEQARQFAALRDEAAAFLEAAVSDEGGRDVPARRRALLEYRARVHRRIVQLDATLDVRGMTDGKGKLRVAWLQRLEGLVATATALDRLLGLERRARRVGDVDPEAVIARYRRPPAPYAPAASPSPAPIVAAPCEAPGGHDADA